MQNPTTMRPATPAPIISERVDRVIPRFQRPTLNVQRSTFNEEDREVKKQNVGHRTPNAENVCEIESSNGKRPTSNAQRPTPNEKDCEVILSFSLPSGRW
jgi:hypothetical protein